ncbi:MAG: hypothetical protein R3338_03580 [Thermoanaerobaculia bacterium]|nr:hypothetical protein [Thermoanaerobaculia bacterium]
MTQTICPDCGKELDDPTGSCPDCTTVIEEVDGRGQSRTLATVIFVLLLIGIVATALAVIFMILG